jgi:hypothetical protein
VSPWTIVLVCVVGAVTMSGFAGMLLQQQVHVVTPTRVKYRLVRGPRGLTRVTTMNYGRWLTLPIHWVHLLRRQPRNWSVTVTAAKGWWENPTLITEDFATNAEAKTRFLELADQIESGEVEPELMNKGAAPPAPPHDADHAGQET